MKLLEKLTQTPGVPGREHRIRELIRAECDGLFDEMSVDTMGSLIGIRKPRGKSDGRGRKGAKPPRVMLAAHMDQIGFLVRFIDDKGFARVSPVGGFDARNLFARTVRVCPDVRDPRKDVKGVMNPATRPIHVATDEDKKKIPEVQEFMIDFALPADEVRRKVKIGDMVVIDGPMHEIGQAVVSTALDNRIGPWIVIEALRKLDKSRTAHACEVAAVFTVQEEVGLRGAATAAYALEPDIGIAVDTTLCVDTPGVPEDQRYTEFGKGAALVVSDSSAIADLDLLEQVESIAKKKKIAHQREVGRGGTDSGTMQRARGGVRTLTLSCPTRYIHTITEMVHKDDLYACRDLLAAYLAQA
jgi:tetrahedral aminopeptidase